MTIYIYSPNNGTAREIGKDEAIGLVSDYNSSETGGGFKSDEFARTDAIARVNAMEDCSEFFAYSFNGETVEFRIAKVDNVIDFDDACDKMLMHDTNISCKREGI